MLLEVTFQSQAVTLSKCTQLACFKLFFKRLSLEPSLLKDYQIDWTSRDWSLVCKTAVGNHLAIDFDQPDQHWHQPDQHRHQPDQHWHQDLALAHLPSLLSCFYVHPALLHWSLEYILSWSRAWWWWQWWYIYNDEVYVTFLLIFWDPPPLVTTTSVFGLVVGWWSAQHCLLIQQSGFVLENSSS